ncbi:Peptidyl-prolyl cis-trans isomerase cyp6 [Bienertia sinuspersici]
MALEAVTGSFFAAQAHPRFLGTRTPKPSLSCFNLSAKNDNLLDCGKEEKDKKLHNSNLLSI